MINPEHHLYPGATWMAGERCVILLAADLEVVRVARKGSSSSETIAVEEFLAAYEPVLPEQDLESDLLGYAAERLLESSETEPGYTGLAMGIFGILQKRDPEWYKDPETSYNLMRLALESVITLELNYSKDVGNNEEVVVNLVRNLYKDLCEATKDLAERLEAADPAPPERE